MLCPMCKDKDITITTGNNETLFTCHACGYSRAHRSVNLFVELWLDWCEEQGFPNNGELPANEKDLENLQLACTKS